MKELSKAMKALGIQVKKEELKKMISEVRGTVVGPRFTGFCRWTPRATVRSTSVNSSR